MADANPNVLLVVVVTADHGEAFGEQCPDRETPAVGHATGAAEVDLHVPLVVSYPGPNRDTGRTVSGPTSLTRFPELTAAVRAGETPRTGGGSAVARSNGDPAPYESPPDTREALRADVSVVYEETEEGVRKVVDGRAGSRERLLATSAWTATDAGPHDRVALTDRSVTRGDAASVDEATQRRLADLGYR